MPINCHRCTCILICRVSGSKAFQGWCTLCFRVYTTTACGEPTQMKTSQINNPQAMHSNVSSWQHASASPWQWVLLASHAPSTTQTWIIFFLMQELEHQNPNNSLKILMVVVMIVQRLHTYCLLMSSHVWHCFPMPWYNRIMSLSRSLRVEFIRLLTSSRNQQNLMLK